MQNNRPEITIVIPNYNGLALLKRNLPSVLAEAERYQYARVLVVDDGSSDNSVEMLKRDFPQITLVVHPKNQGFAEAVHSGVKAAEAELVFILNSDVELHADCLSMLAIYFDDANTFSVNPLIYDEQSEIKRHSWNYRQFKKGALKLLSWKLDEARNIVANGKRCPTLYGHGGSMLVRKSMFQAMDGFDPIFKPYYGEDSDIGIRAWRRGWYSYFEPNASIVHQSIGSIRTHVKMQQIKCIRRRNRYVLEWIHLTPAQLIFSALPVSIFQLFGELITLDLVNLKGFWLALGKIPEVFDSRKKIAQTEVFSLKQALEIIKSKAV